MEETTYMVTVMNTKDKLQAQRGYKRYMVTVKKKRTYKI